jgi:GAF domain-containing protein
MMAGSTPVPSERRLPDLRALLQARLRDAAEALAYAEAEVFDACAREALIDGLARTGAHEGTVWLLDEARAFLIPRFNTGPRAAEFVGRFRQTLRSGMISMVVATEQPICENEVHKNQRQDRTLDTELRLRTCAMVAVPLYYAGELRGVISGVQLAPAEGPAEDPPGFTVEDLQQLQRTATLLSRLIEHRLLTAILGAELYG